MLEHHLYSTLAAAESGIKRETYKHIQESYHIVEDNSSGVAGNKVCTVCCHQRGKEAEKSDGCVIADQLDDLHEGICDLLEQSGNLRLRPAAHLNAESEEDTGYNQLQDGTAAPEFRKVRLGKESDNQFPGIHFRSR